MTSSDGRSMQAQGDVSSVKSDAFEVDEDDDDVGISFTAAATAYVREGKYCLDKTTMHNVRKVCLKSLHTESVSRRKL